MTRLVVSDRTDPFEIVGWTQAQIAALGLPAQPTTDQVRAALEAAGYEVLSLHVFGGIEVEVVRREAAQP